MPGEELGEQPGLHDRGVLVLVEQHDAVAVALDLGDAGLAAEDLEGERDLVGVLDEAAAALGLAVLGREIDEHVEGAHRLDPAVDLGVGAPAARRQVAHGREPAREGPHLLGVRDVLRERPRDAEHRPGDGIEVLAEVGQTLVARADDRRAGELPRGGLADHGAVALAAEGRGVVAVERVRVGVVGRDRRGLEGVAVVAEHPDAGEVADALADAGGELPRGLAREGQAEDLARTHEVIGEQPQHATGHRLGLARAGARDHEGGGER